jgi:DNA-binding NtrC family response regulator
MLQATLFKAMTRGTGRESDSMPEKTSVLIVDDDAILCDTMSLILEESGYDVIMAGDGPAAIERVTEQSFDIIFIDMRLPALNGLETYLAIRDLSPGSVAVMMTAYRYEMADLVEEALSDNACTCLYKPLDMDQVLRLVDEILERKRKSPRNQG